jgi:hypothetical protein
VDTDPAKAWEIGQNMGATNLWKISSDDVPGIFNPTLNPTDRSDTHTVWDTEIDLPSSVVNSAIRGTAPVWTEVEDLPEVP